MSSLKISSFDVKDVVFADTTSFADGVLRVRESELRELLLADRDLGDVKIDITKPGEATRIIHLYDVIEPRTKVAGPGTIFPGWLGSTISSGEGEINRLAGMALVTCTELPSEGDEYTVQGEGIIDMSGPAAPMTPLSQTNNLVLEFMPGQRKISVEEYTKVITKAGLKAADYLAKATVGKPPTRSEERPLILQPKAELPTVVLIMVIAGSSFAMDTFINGYSCIGTLPTLLHPNEIAEGALVSFTGMSCGAANKTYFHQTNPLIENLYKYHGVKHNFGGVIIARGYSYEYDDKERLDSHAAKLARFLGADGAVITCEAGGHILVDTMLVCRECEKRGIKTAVVMMEMGGKDGGGSPFTDFVPQADLVVSVGNVDEFVQLPAMERALGGRRIFDTGTEGPQATEIASNQICGAHVMLGPGRARGVYAQKV